MVKCNCTFNDDWLIEFDWVEKAPMHEPRIVNYATINLIFLILEEVRSLATQNGRCTKIRTFLGSQLQYQFLQKRKSDVANFTVSDLGQGKSPSALSSTSGVQHRKQCTLPGFLQNSGVTEAEILWAIQIVLTHSSLRFCDDLSKFFGRMFSDSMVAKSFTLGRTKCSYFISFGITPYLKELLIAKLKYFDFFVACYDESLNRVLQEEQMDKLLDKLLESLSTLDLGKLLQVSMDGPNFNWDVLKIHSSYREQNKFSKLIKIGS